MHTPRISFNAGEVSPLIAHRTDFDKSSAAAERMENFLASPYGAAIKRPGLRHVEDAPTAAVNSALRPFVASDGTRYLLHFSPDTLTILRASDGTIADTLPFMPDYSWPDGWDDTLRALQLVQINDVAWICHPGTFPLQLSRYGDTDWDLSFIEFPRAPMADGNTDTDQRYTVASNPIAPLWTSAASYDVGDISFYGGCEWKCTTAHTATSTTTPGQGDDWQDYWRRMTYEEGDAITLIEGDSVSLLESDLSNPLWIGPQTIQYYPGDLVTVEHSFSGNPASTILLVCFDSHLATESMWGTGPAYLLHYPAGIDGGAADDIAAWCWLTEYQNAVDYSYTVGLLVYSGDVIYRCILDHTGALPTPLDPAYWEATDIPFDSSSVTGAAAWASVVLTSYATGDAVFNNDRTFECLADHECSTDSEPGTGTNWETYWEETSPLVGELAANNYSPGLYFKISPERDETDFQIELKAKTSNNGKTSNVIAMHGDWDFFSFGTWTGTFKLQRSTDGGDTWETIRSWQATDDRNVADSGTQDEPAMFRLMFESEDGTDSSGDQRGIFIPAEADVTGYALMTVYVSAYRMTGIAKTSLLSGNTWDWAECPFNSRDGFPRAIALHESRLVFAGTSSLPVSLWFSQIDDLTNFETGSDDSDGIFATLALTNASPIRWIGSQRRMFIGTKFGEWVAGSETSDSPLTPTNFLARQYDSKGSYAIQPIIAESALIYLERKGCRMRELSFDAAVTGSYSANDLTRLAHHLAADGICAMAWQQTREPGMWAVTRAGVLLHFAYNRPERVMAWTRHTTTGGLFRDVVVFPSDEGDDEVFFLVERDTPRLERFDQHWFSTIEAGGTGLCRDGEEAVAITATLRTLPIEFHQEGTHARRKRLDKISLSLYQSGGGTVYNTAQGRAQDIPSPLSQYTGWVDVVPDPGHADEIRLNIIHADAKPFILRAAAMRWQQHER